MKSAKSKGRIKPKAWAMKSVEDKGKDMYTVILQASLLH